MRKTLEAAVRLMPTPPAFRDIKKMVGESMLGLENISIASVLAFVFIDPSNLTKLKPLALK